MIIRWLDTSAAEAFGRTLAATFIQRVPKGVAVTEKKFKQRAQEALVKLGRQVAEFRARESLNFYKKAKLGNAFKWTLLDAGYERGYVDELTEWLMLQVK